MNIEDIPPALRAAICDCAAGRIPAEIAAMRFMAEASAPAEAEKMLERAIDGCGKSPNGPAARLGEAKALIVQNAGAWATVKAVLAGVEHGGSRTAIARWAEIFDRAAAISPEAGVALYSLGNPELLHKATAEVVEWIRERRLTGSAHRVLDIGCGIGRFEEALAPEIGQIIGHDISGEMIAIAKRRCRALPNVSFALSSGHDLSTTEDGIIDLVLAVDVFPYLVQAGSELAAAHVKEAARVLKPGGSLLILNYSYREDLGADNRDVADAAVAARLKLTMAGMKPFKHWDGTAYLLENVRSFVSL